MKTPMLLAAAGLFTAMLCYGQEKIESASLASLVEAERAFAKRSVENGARAAFLEFFADDGIVFRPHPVIYKDAIKNVPLPANPLARTLDWEPIYADVSASGDLGYTTGPYTLTDNTTDKRAENYGYFFSVWKKQSARTWKVALDLGIEVSEPFMGSRIFRSAASPAWSGTTDSMSTAERQTTLLNAELELLTAARADGMLDGFLRRLNDEARVYRPGIQPLVAKEAIRAFLEKSPPIKMWEPISANVAESNDLGYVYGRYETSGGESDQMLPEKGYFTRVWKRDAAGAWKIAFDVTIAVPPDASKQ